MAVVGSIPLVAQSERQHCIVPLVGTTERDNKHGLVTFKDIFYLSQVGGLGR